MDIIHGLPATVIKKGSYNTQFPKHVFQRNTMPLRVTEKYVINDFISI